MDVYAVGVLFYEMATLEWPLQPKAGDHSPMAWRNAHLLTAPKDIRMLRSDLPVELVQLIMQMLQKSPVKRPASWKEVAERLKVGKPAAGSPDVSALLHKATSTFIQATAAEVRAREERERLQERKALLEQAFSDPVVILRSLVDAYNSATAVGKLTLRVLGPLQVEVKAPSGHRRLVLDGQTINDLDTGHNGIVRIIGVVRLEPTPTPHSPNEVFTTHNSFGSFNLVYRVSKATERFGSWTQFRFEKNPLTAQMSYPRWFGIPLQGLPRELQVLQAVGLHQHEHRHLDDEWFKALLVQML